MRISTTPHPLSWATPTDAAELADVMFDAVRNGPSKYTQAKPARDRLSCLIRTKD